MLPTSSQNGAEPHPRIALVVASPEILGGHSVEASLLASALRAEGVPVGFVPVDPRLPRALAWVRKVRYLRTLVNQALYLPSLARVGGADVVHVFSASYWSFLLGPAPALLAARVLGKRAILNYHSGEAEDHLSRWGPLVHPWLRLAHEIVVPSEYLRRVFERYGLPARVVPNVVDLSRYRFREREPLRAELLTTRNLEPHYRVEDSIRALELLRARHPQARLTVVGYGSQEAVLRRFAGRLPPAAVRFLGRVQPEAMPRVYDEADVFVNASVVDNQPLSILEAFAAGCPVVTTGPGDIPNMLARGRGLVVPERDPAALAAAVSSLLERPARARELARRAREHVEAHTWSQVRPRWAAVYAGKAS